MNYAKMKLAIILSLLLLLTACSPSASDVTAQYAIKPDGLKDCQFYELFNSGGSHITVVRCPNSDTSTTFRSGNTTQTTVVIDGKEYVGKK